MILRGAGSIKHDALIDLDQADDFDFKPGLFANLAVQRFFEALACFHDAAGQRPPVFERLAGPFDKQDAVAFDDESPYAQNRTFGISAANIATLP
jgi:hypothetical protein